VTCSLGGEGVTCSLAPAAAREGGGCRAGDGIPPARVPSDPRRHDGRWDQAAGRVAAPPAGARLMTTPATARALAELLAPYADPDPRQGARLVDVPPGVAAALDLLPPEQGTGRPNGIQPPARWLGMAATDLDGRLVGSLIPGHSVVRFDGVPVPVASARTLAVRVAEAWPATPDVSGALGAGVAEAWASWAADAPALWSGNGAGLLTRPPPDAAVVGLLWD